MPVELDYWAGRLARKFRDEPKKAERDLKEEAKALRDHLKATAPRAKGRLMRSIYAKEFSVITYVAYAEVQNEGAKVVPKRRAWLTIPLRKGYRASSRQFFTINGRDGNQYVLRKKTRELWAIRRRSIVIPGSGWMDRGLRTHLMFAEERLADAFAERVT